MRKAIILILLSAAFATAAFGQLTKQIESIRAEVGQINKNAPKYKKRTGNVEGISLEGTEATFFTSGRGLKKITAKIFGETFRATAELYFSEEEIIFGYRKFERYDTQLGVNPPPKVAKVTETRVYFVGEKAVRVIDHKTILPNASRRFGELESEMKELVKKLKDAYLN